jgi:hypothetical protein
MAPSEQWKWNKNSKRLRSKIPQSASAPGDWRSRMERAIRQQAREMAQLHETFDNMARMVEAHPSCEEMQWLGMKESLDNRERKWDASNKDDVLWGTGISDIITKILD